MLKRLLKSRLSERWRWRLHRLSRLRWITKYKLLREKDASVRRHLGYLLLDPEVESFTYTVANTGQMLSTISEVTGVALTDLQRFAGEAMTDPELTGALRRRLRWRFDVKHRQRLGHRLGWYVLIRALHPSLVCETGIYHGLGSLVILRALERNAHEGRPGTLLSLDVSSDAGSIIDRNRHPAWQPIVGLTTETLNAAVGGRRIGALFHDTPHTEANQRFEFETALANADDRLLLVDGSGGQLPVLERLAREHEGTYRRVGLVAADHWYPAPGLALALFGSSAQDSGRPDRRD